MTDNQKLEEKIDILLGTKTEYLTVQETALELKVSQRQVFILAKKGLLKPYKFCGRRTYFKRTEIFENMRQVQQKQAIAA